MTTRGKKERLDAILVEKGFFETKSQAQGAILAGHVKINGQSALKAGSQISRDAELEIEIKSLPYVSRGGLKLEKALKEFGVSAFDKICLDNGASTGGFTDCLLQNHAQKVYAVDVGYGQLAWKLRNDPKVVVIERTNIRHSTPADIYGDSKAGENRAFAQLATIDLSFISILKILKNVKSLLNPESHEIIALIKPQFEAGKEQIPKSGVVKDRNIHVNVIRQVAQFADSLDLYPTNLTWSPIKGPAGNIEYLIHLKSEEGRLKDEKIETVVDESYERLLSG